MNYAQILNEDIANGNGIRVSLFVSGCNFHCQGCFNGEAQSFDYGSPYNIDTENQIVKACKQPFISGLSILGGDPLWQDYSGVVLLRNLCDEIHCMHKTVWLWTGFTWEEVFAKSEDKAPLIQIARQALLSSCDVVVDGRYMENERDVSLPFRGSRNQRIIDVKASLKQNQIVLYELT